MQEKVSVLTIQRKLLAWGKKHGIEYPWRYADDPYKVLTSEFMLHRTQASQASRVYKQFMENWPTLEDFATSEAGEVEKILEPLGLHWRIRAMIDALDHAWANYRKIPLDVETLKAFPGVGDYIAGATVCFSTNKAIPLVDTNTVRVIGRLFGLRLAGEARRRKEVREAIAVSCPSDEPRDFYYSVIDFAHEVCRPIEPDCQGCPLLHVPCRYGMEIVGTTVA